MCVGQLRYQTDVLGFVNPCQVLSQSSGVGDDDYGSGSGPGSVGTIEHTSVAGRRHADGPGVILTDKKGRPDIQLFPLAVFVHCYENAAIVL